MPPFAHASVLLKEAVASLRCRAGGIYVDGTVGGGGHAFAILEASAPDGRLIGMDRDEDALAAAAERLRPFGNRVTLVRGNAGDLSSVLDDLGLDGVDGILLDLGVSSYQLDEGERGFSFSRDGHLDMRMDRRQGLSAANVVNDWPEEELARIIRDYGEERMAKRIARAVAAKRREASLTSTAELAAVIAAVVPVPPQGPRIHPATRTFQAIRIAVNDELGSLQRSLDSGIRRLRQGGRFSVIAFHSLEDRIVKETFAAAAKGCTCPPSFPVCICGKRPILKVVTRKPVRPTPGEEAENPRARSAKLRTAERI